MVWLPWRRSRDPVGAAAVTDPSAGADPPTVTDPPTGAGRLDEALRVLAGAGTVAFGPVGFAAAVLPETAAFQTVQLTAKHGGEGHGGEGLRHRLEGLLGEAGPAGRIYAAALLDVVDPEAGRRAWRSLSGDRAEVATMSGCLMDRTTVGEYARSRLR